LPPPLFSTFSPPLPEIQDISGSNQKHCHELRGPSSHPSSSSCGSFCTRSVTCIIRLSRVALPWLGPEGFSRMLSPIPPEFPSSLKRVLVFFCAAPSVRVRRLPACPHHGCIGICRLFPLASPAFVLCIGPYHARKRPLLHGNTSPRISQAVHSLSRSRSRLSVCDFLPIPT